MRDPVLGGLLSDVPLRTSLRFSAATHKVNCGSASVIDDLQEMTSIQWVWINAFPTESRIWQKGYTGAHGTSHFIAMEDFGTQQLLYQFSRGTSSQLLNANVANFAAWGTGKWLFVVSRSHATTSGSNDLNVGDLWRPPAGPSAYNTRTAGSGAFLSDAAAGLYLGNRENDNVALDGRIALCAWYSRRLTDVEMLQAWHGWYWHTGLVGLWQPGHMGASTVLDLSGRGNTGTVTGAGLSFGPQLVDPSMPDDIFAVIAAAGGTTVRPFTLMGVG